MSTREQAVGDDADSVGNFSWTASVRDDDDEYVSDGDDASFSSKSTSTTAADSRSDGFKLVGRSAELEEVRLRRGSSFETIETTTTMSMTTRISSTSSPSRAAAADERRARRTQSFSAGGSSPSFGRRYSLTASIHGVHLVPKCLLAHRRSSWHFHLIPGHHHHHHHRHQHHEEGECGHGESECPHAVGEVGREGGEDGDDCGNERGCRQHSEANATTTSSRRHHHQPHHRDSISELFRRHFHPLSFHGFLKHPHYPKIKAADGGFFENFGTLDKSVAIKRYQSVKKTQQRTAVTPVDCDPAPGSRDDDFYPTSVPVIRDSSASKLIECCVDKDSEELAQLGEEVLYVVLHSPALSDSRRNRLIRHVADVFKLGDDQKRISLVRDKTPPRWKLDITVHEGRKLKENQPDGSSDPYCELSVFDPSSCDAKSAERQFRTGVKFRTLHPQWEESFTAEPIDHTSEILQITVRDQAAEEIHLKERVKQIEQVKGVKGAYRYVRNVAQAISPGQTGGHSSHSMLGKVVVKLKVLEGPFVHH